MAYAQNPEDLESVCFVLRSLLTLEPPSVVASFALLKVRDQNVQAAVAIANVVKSSLGPHGLDKMMVRC